MTFFTAKKVTNFKTELLVFPTFQNFYVGKYPRVSINFLDVHILPLSLYDDKKTKLNFMYFQNSPACWDFVLFILVKIIFLYVSYFSIVIRYDWILDVKHRDHLDIKCYRILKSVMKLLFSKYGFQFFKHII